MRILSAAVIMTALFAAPVPALADDQPTMEEKLQDALRGLMEDMQPALDDALEDTLQFFGAFGAVDDPRHYTLPEVLPNGDIIIRRRDDAPAYQPPASPSQDGEGDSIDL